MTSFYVWPVSDEGLNGFFASDLARNWKWQFFYTSGQLPPLLTWILAIFFKNFDSPFFNLWIIPAIASVFTLVFSYAAARQFFSKSFSMLFLLVFAFSFWPLYWGRFCHQGVLIIFWECVTVFLWGRFLKTRSNKNNYSAAFFVGLSTGLCSFMFTSWPFVSLWIVTTVFLFSYSKPEKMKNKHFFIFFMTGLLGALIPFLCAVFVGGYGGHILGSTVLTGWYDWTDQLVTGISYVTAIFAGPIKKGTSYGPLWGGMLNPILGSAFFLGLAYLWKFRRSSFSKWLIGGFLILMLPGFLSADYVEMFRIAQVMPLVLLIATIGLQWIVVNLKSKTGLAFFTVFLILSLLLDFYQFSLPALKTGPGFNLQFKRDVPDENFNAYRILDSVNQRSGPGLIFSDLLLLSHNHMLPTMTYHFNAAINPKLDPSKAKWAAIEVNAHYEQLLKKRFPDSYWTAVSVAPLVNGGMVLGVIPVNDKNREVFKKWKRANEYIHDLSIQSEEIISDRKKYADALMELPKGYQWMQGDPLLESVFGEWLAQYHWGTDYSQNIIVLQRAINHGYPCALLYVKLGEYLFLDHRLLEAKTAFEKALGCYPNQTEAGDWLQTTNQMMAQNKGK
ncbi:MAG TPA: glycosyltransferase family 39 protein [bacterium]|nr:glycosyltransferase family 39 protein [bacterium]